MLAYEFRVGTASGNYFKYSSPTAHGSPKILLSEKNWPKKMMSRKWFCPEILFDLQMLCPTFFCQTKCLSKNLLTPMFLSMIVFGSKLFFVQNCFWLHDTLTRQYQLNFNLSVATFCIKRSNSCYILCVKCSNSHLN